jgi:hypothetical protein
MVTILPPIDKKTVKMVGDIAAAAATATANVTNNLDTVKKYPFTIAEELLLRDRGMM